MGLKKTFFFFPFLKKIVTTFAPRIIYKTENEILNSLFSSPGYFWGSILFSTTCLKRIQWPYYMPCSHMASFRCYSNQATKQINFQQTPKWFIAYLMTLKTVTHLLCVQTTVCPDKEFLNLALSTLTMILTFISTNDLD